MSQLPEVTYQLPHEHPDDPGPAAADLMDRWYAAWCAHEPSAIGACLDRHAILEEPGGLHRGRNCILDWAVTVFRALPDFHLEMLDAWTSREGAVVATYFRASGTLTGPYDPPGLAATNAPITFEGMDRNELRGGKIARHQIFYDMTEISRQVGAAPRPGTFGERLTIRIQHLAARRQRGKKSARR